MTMVEDIDPKTLKHWHIMANCPFTTPGKELPELSMEIICDVDSMGASLSSQTMGA
jgi:hypothetical protein